MSAGICTWVRQELAAYREEDGDDRDRSRILDHLGTCPACQVVAADYQKSGDLIRGLPAIVPSPEFRTAVFAAIRSEALRQAPTRAEISRAATNPELPVVKVSAARGTWPRPTSQPQRPQLRWTALRVSLVAAAALLLISLLGARLLTRGGTSALGSSAASLSGASAPKIDRYPTSHDYVLPTSAMATASWLVYTASNTSHLAEIIALNRGTKQAAQLLPQPAATALTVRALTSRWVLWTAGTGTSASQWRLYASPLGPTGGSQPVMLLDSESTSPGSLATLGGIWADNDTVLVAGAPHSGTGELLKIDLASGDRTPAVIARGHIQGDILTDPSLDQGSYYWADVWSDRATGLHSSICKGDGSGQSLNLSPAQTDFHPQVSQHTLVWVDVAESTLQRFRGSAAAGTPDGDMAMLRSLGGLLDERDLVTGQKWQLSTGAMVPSIVVAGHLLLWQYGAQTHAYDISRKAPLAADSVVHSASLASATASSIAWLEGSAESIFVYDAA